MLIWLWLTVSSTLLRKITLDGYKNKQDCHFNFESPPASRIVVHFLDFRLEDEYDFLHFRKLYTIDTQMLSANLTFKIRTLKT